MTLRTYQGVVYPAQCDAMGHMNVQHYVAAFDQALWHLMAACGYSPSWISERREGWADVRYEIDFRGETAVGSLFVVDSNVRHVGTKSLRSWHRLSTPEGTRAELLATSVYFDLDFRQAKEIPDIVRQGAEAFAAASGQE